MESKKIARYQRGGDIWERIKNELGAAAADVVAEAATSGDEYRVNDAYKTAKFGANLDDSTTDIFFGQMYNDPFAAPIEQADKIISNAGKAVKKAISDNFKNPILWFILIAAGIVLFWWIGGFRIIRGILGR
jgi:hypothetical protein